MQPIAKWLVARPQHAVAALAATLVLPFSTLTSGATLVLLILHSGVQQAAFYGAIAAAFTVGLGYVTGLPVGILLATVVGVWIPVGLLAQLMQRTRSLTLVLQLSVVVALCAIVAFNVVVDDPTAVGRRWLDQMITHLREIEQHGQADTFAEVRDVAAPMMLMGLVLVSWVTYVMVLMLGYALYRCLPAGGAPFGRFSDLNFGRVLAIIAVVTLGLGFLVQIPLIEQLSTMLIAAFCVQGLALLHWLQVERGLPLLLVMVAYLFVLPFAAIYAMVGFADAWLNLRPKIQSMGGTRR